MPYVIQNTFILVPPALFAATIYMCLGRTIRLVDGDHLSVIRPRILTKVFVSGDILSFLIQGGASGLFVMGSTKPSFTKVATAMVIVGLVVQLVSFILFGLCAVIFHKRIRRQPTSRSFQVDANWTQTLYMLYGVSTLILIRSIFRIIEYAFGNDGYPLTHEWTLYLFDSLPMIIVTVIFFFRYPSNLVTTREDDIAIHLEGSVPGEHIIPK